VADSNPRRNTRHAASRTGKWLSLHAQHAAASNFGAHSACVVAESVLAARRAAARTRNCGWRMAAASVGHRREADAAEPATRGCVTSITVSAASNRSGSDAAVTAACASVVQRSSGAATSSSACPPAFNECVMTRHPMTQTNATLPTWHTGSFFFLFLVLFSQ